MNIPGRISLAIGVTAALATTLTSVPASADAKGTSIVINEFYGGGGNKGAELTSDFVELYNPTDHPISVDGWSVQYLAAKATTGTAITPLKGVIEPGGYLLVKGAKGNGGTKDFAADITNDQLAMGGTAGSVVLTESTTPWTSHSAAVDLAGFGGVQNFEGTPGPTVSATTSASRADKGVDTDDNGADFRVGAPSPRYSKGDALGGEDTPGVEQPAPGEDGDAATIEDIQGTGATSPLDGKRVQTHGWVTASYPKGGLQGFYIQMGGPGELRKPGEASRGVFVYSGRQQPAKVGVCVAVTGTVGEHYEATQISSQSTQVLSGAEADKACGPKATPIPDSIPTDPEQREANEGMMFQPTATYTVTDNYPLTTYGSMSLVEGEEPLYQSTQKVRPGAEAIAYEKENQRRVIGLDDGASTNIQRSKEGQSTPQPYLSTAEGIRSLRAGDHVHFQQPTVLAYNFDNWTLQPTGQVTGDMSRDELPIGWEDSRPAEAKGPQEVGGSHSIASFNVLNYFTHLGQDVNGCGSYNDRDGHPVTAKDCDARGAYTQEAFHDQQAKIVSAINSLDVSVLGLEEIENSSKFGEDRDAALKNLVSALNAAGGNWQFVPSPKQVPTQEDFIRTAFIYNPDKARPVGESRIVDNEAFTGIARQPLAQEFEPAGGGDSFVAVLNHYKSKGSVARGDADTGDGQGNNARLRAAMSRELLKWIGEQKDWADKAQFILGDLNSYAQEDAVTALEDGGFTNVEAKYNAGNSYLFGGREGSLDHVMANKAALGWITGADVWDINSDESVAFEYSRRNNNVVDFYAEDPFRSSDHDPIKVGFNPAGAQPGQPGPGKPGSEQPGSGKPGLGSSLPGSSVLGSLSGRSS